MSNNDAYDTEPIFPLSDYDGQTLLYGMARNGAEFTAVEMNKLSGRNRTHGADIASYASLQRLVKAGLLERSSRERGCATYKFSLLGTIDLLETFRFVAVPVA